MRFLRIFILFSLIPIPSSLAEYRAYQLLIKNTETGTERSVVSTLDHLQYPTYHPLNSQETISYVTSWMCWGTSDHHQDICPAPEASEPERFPASQ